MFYWELEVEKWRWYHRHEINIILHDDIIIYRYTFLKLDIYISYRILRNFLKLILHKKLYIYFWPKKYIKIQYCSMKKEKKLYELYDSVWKD